METKPARSRLQGSCKQPISPVHSAARATGWSGRGGGGELPHFRKGETTSFSNGNSGPGPGERHTGGAEIPLLGCLETEDLKPQHQVWSSPSSLFPTGASLAVSPVSFVSDNTSFFCN